MNQLCSPCIKCARRGAKCLPARTRSRLQTLLSCPRAAAASSAFLAVAAAHCAPVQPPMAEKSTHERFSSDGSGSGSGDDDDDDDDDGHCHCHDGGDGDGDAS